MTAGADLAVVLAFEVYFWVRCERARRITSYVRHLFLRAFS